MQVRKAATEPWKTGRLKRTTDSIHVHVTCNIRDYPYVFGIAVRHMLCNPTGKFGGGESVEPLTEA